MVDGELAYTGEGMMDGDFGANLTWGDEVVSCSGISVVSSGLSQFLRDGGGERKYSAANPVLLLMLSPFMTQERNEVAEKRGRDRSVSWLFPPKFQVLRYTLVCGVAQASDPFLLPSISSVTIDSLLIKPARKRHLVGTRNARWIAYLGFPRNVTPKIRQYFRKRIEVSRDEPG